MIQLWLHILPITENVQLDNSERIELFFNTIFAYILLCCAFR